MNDSKDENRKRSKHDDDSDYRREKKQKRARSRSRSPAGARDKEPRRKRRHSKSQSPQRRVKSESHRVDTAKEAEVKKEVPERKKKETDMLNTRTGGAYIPPARLRMMQAQITDKSSMAYQRLAWEALKKSIHGHINKINVGNIGIIIKELLKENIVRGRGLLCRSVIQAQAASPTFTNVYAALVAAVNSRFPNIGELLLKRLVIQFKRGFKRNDKPICISSASFIAHLVNQRVAHEILALELLTLLVETPTDDSVEVAIAFLKECGQKLTEVSSKGCNAIFEMLRNILHEGQLDKRVQYMIEVMFQVWKDGFKDHPAVVEELELVPEEEQFTHLLMLDDATDSQDILNVFKFDEKYEENEQKYKTLSKEILGSDAESEEGSGESGSEESDDDDEQEEEAAEAEKKMTIIDNTETNLVALRRTIYLTINSSLDFEECAHKLMKMQLKPGQEVELCHMFLDCCAEQRTYEKFYGLLAQRFCNINRIYIAPFEEIFKESYATAHRLDTNRLRNVSKFFAHLLFTDSIGWEVLECVKLNEEDTTSSSRIYIKILFQELAEYMGLKKLNDRLKDPTLQESFYGVFPRDNPKNTRFSINFFTSIGLGGLTDELREHLKQMPKNVPPPVTEIQVESGSDSSSSSSSSSDSSSSSSSDSSDSEDESSKKKSKKQKTKKGNSKEKTPKTPQEEEQSKNTERWGHDGFYDTYGKDARRFQQTDTRTDKDNFARPREIPDNRRNRNPRDDSRNRDTEDRRRNDDQGSREDGSRDRREGDRDRREDDRSRDNNKGRRDDERDRRDDDRGRDNDRGRRDDERDRREDVRGRDDERDRREDNRGRDNERGRRDDERDKREDDRGRDNDRGRRDNERDRREDDRGRDNDRGRRDDERDRREDDRGRDNDRGRRDDERDRREDYKGRDYDKRRRDDERVREEDESRRVDDSRRKEDDKGKRNDDDRYRREKDDDKVRKDNDRSRKDDERTRSDDERPRKSDERSRYDERSSKGDERSRYDERSRKDDDRSRKDERNRSNKTDDRSERNDKSRKAEDRDEFEVRPRKENKSRRDNDKRDSDDESNRRYDKENRRNKDKSRDKSSRKEDSDSSDDDRRKRDKKKEKERHEKIDDSGWDIRGSSIRRELPVGRYWDN